MRIRFVSVALFFLILTPAAIPADEPEPSSSRWGITTKKDLEHSPDTIAIEETESTPDAATQIIAPTPSSDQTGTPPSVNADTGTVPVSEAPTNAVETLKIDPTQKSSPGKQASTRKKPTSAATGKGVTPQAINWSSEGQKEACAGYLEDLRALFLKTRHFSIQGASCDTAVSAAAFLDSMETCQRNCPEGLLEYSGYSERIIRNIRYLEKLGNDRCSGTLAPVSPVTKTP